MSTTRRAVIARSSADKPTVYEVAAYLPSRYRVAGATDTEITIEGEDYAGWTLDGYVIPRLASGLIFAKEVDAT